MLETMIFTIYYLWSAQWLSYFSYQPLIFPWDDALRGKGADGHGGKARDDVEHRNEKHKRQTKGAKSGHQTWVLGETTEIYKFH